MNAIFLIPLFASLVSAKVYDKSAWEAWKKETYDSHMTSTTSFLNATSLVFAKEGKRLYLAEGSSRNSTKWSKTPVGGFVAVAKNSDNQGVLTRPAKKDVVVNDKQKRYSWDLKNGAIAEVVYGTSSKKVWGYIYNPDQIKSFTGFRFYPFDPTAVVEGVYKPGPRRVVSYKTVQGDQREVADVGKVTFTLRGKPYTLTAYNWQDPGEKLKYIALIFTDLKAGSETYPGGRELAVVFDEDFKEGQPMKLDFNRTGNFYCAHSPYWHCPTGLQEKIDIEVNAGEMLPLKKIVQEKT